MKTIIVFLFICVSLTQTTFSQSNPAQYMPLQIGNKWVYMYRPQAPHDSAYIVSQIIGDTIINFKNYFKITHFRDTVNYIRFDTLTSTLVEYCSDPTCSYEHGLFQLAASNGDSISTCAAFPIICRGVNDTLLFGNNTYLKTFTHYSINYYCVYSQKYNFLYGIGLNYEYQSSVCRASAIWAIYLRGAYINGVLYGDTSSTFTRTVTGIVKYRDNNHPVSSGYVKAFKHSYIGDIVIEDSAAIQLDGSYTIRLPHDTTDLMAFQNDEVMALNFVPTYYPSTIYWQNAGHIYTDTNMTGIDISVYRITNDGSSHGQISGGVYLNTNTTTLTGLGYAIVYAKTGNTFRGYSISAGNGAYSVDSLPHGMYQLICTRMGYPSQTKNRYLGNNNLTGVNFIYGRQLVGIPDGNEIPLTYSLSQNYPNPFNPATTIKFGLPKSSQVKLTIYDLLGREISVLVNGNLSAGSYKAEWDASNYSSGVYIYRIESSDFVQVKKLVLIK